VAVDSRGVRLGTTGAEGVGMRTVGRQRRAPESYEACRRDGAGIVVGRKVLKGLLPCAADTMAERAAAIG